MSIVMMLLEIAVAVEHLDAPVAAVGNVNGSFGVSSDAVHGIELRLAFAGLAERLDPVAVLAQLGDAGIDVTVADEDITLRDPR
jgi:hypothetical protein